MENRRLAFTMAAGTRPDGFTGLGFATGASFDASLFAEGFALFALVLNWLLTPSVSR